MSTLRGGVLARIMIIDDERLIVRMVRFVFEEAGHHVIATQKPAEAIDLAEAKLPDAIVCDIIMPGLSGWDLLEALRENETTKHIPIILLSGLEDAADRVRGLRSGADDFLTKPYDPAELLARVETLIARHDGPAGLQGDLKAQSLLELLQNLHHHHKTGVLTLTATGGQGSIIFKAGQINAAAFENLTGSHAVETMLDQSTGHFSFQLKEAVKPNSETLDVNQLLLDLAWKTDELDALKQYLPDQNQTLQITKPLTDTPKSHQNIPVKQVYAAIRDQSATNLRTLLARPAHSPLNIELALAWLVEAGFVGEKHA